MHTLLMAGDFAVSSRVPQVPFCSACHFSPGSLGKEAGAADNEQHHVPAKAGAGDSSHPESLR